MLIKTFTRNCRHLRGKIQEPVFANRNVQTHYKQQGNRKQADRLAVKTEHVTSRRGSKIQLPAISRDTESSVDTGTNTTDTGQNGDR